MFRTFFWYAAGWTYLLITMPALFKIKYLEKRGRIRERDCFANRFSMRLARRLFYLTGSDVNVSGLEHIPQNRPVLLVSNHQSHMDSAIIHGFLNIQKGFIADREVLNIPILRTWLKYMKCVFITRGDIRSNVLKMEKCVQLLKEGHSLVIYPEGKLDEGKELGEFKKGCVKLALRAGVPIVPLTLRNSGRIMSRDGSRINRVTVQCIISGPVEIGMVNKPDENEIARKIRDIIERNLTV